MKSVLILAHDFPPLNTIGAQRPYSWYKYFQNFNIQSTVITKNWNTDEKYNTIENESIIKVNISSPTKNETKNSNPIIGFLRKISTLISIYFHHIFLSTNPKYRLHKAADNFLSKNKVDYIIATGEPFILFIYASKLSKKYKIPWIADYRDGWSFNYHLNHHFLNRLLLKPFYKQLEKKYVKNACFLTTVSTPIQTELKKLLPSLPIHLVYNGYDSELFNFQFKKNNTTELTFIYQRIDIFFEAIHEYILENPHQKIKIDFYGIDNFKSSFSSLIKLYPKLERYIHVFPKIPHQEILEKQSQADVLLLFAGSAVDGSAAKIFEYFVLNKKILLVVNDNGTLFNLISKTNSGIICENKNDVKKAIQDLYYEWEINGEIKNHTINFEEYSRNNQTQKLAELIHNN